MNKTKNVYYIPSTLILNHSCGVLYPRASCPCYASANPAFQFLPKYGFASAVLSNALELPRSDALTDSTMITGSSPHASSVSFSNDSNTCSSILQDSDLAGVLLREDGLDDARMVQGVPGSSDAYLTLLCMGNSDEIYGLMQAALLQRDTWLVKEPLVGILFDPIQCSLIIVIGWIERNSTLCHVSALWFSFLMYLLANPICSRRFISHMYLQVQI